MKNIITIFISILSIFTINLETLCLTVTMQEHFNNNNYVCDTYKKSKNLFKDKIKRVVIISPCCITGGPENLCQIYKELKKQGFDVYMHWLNNYCTFFKRYKNGQWYLSACQSNIKAYEKEYDVIKLDHEVLLDQDTLIIIPEIWCDMITFFEKAVVAIAWLSINNLHAVNKSEICRSLINEKKLNDLDCFHLVQAPWIQKKLDTWGAESFLLGDYISSCYLMESTKSKIDKSIAYYPKKGAEFSEQFIHLYSEFNYIRLENLNQIGMISALDSAQIYIDFGAFPGKDRIPREALLRNCIIFIRNVGCATDYDSFPIDDYFRFSDQDIVDGTLYKKVHETLSDYENMKEKQNFMRNQVLQEYEIFKQNIQECFGKPLE